MFYLFRHRYDLLKIQTEYFDYDPIPGRVHPKLTAADFLPKPLLAKSFFGDWPILNAMAFLTHEKFVKNPTIEVPCFIVVHLVFCISQWYQNSRIQ